MSLRVLLPILLAVATLGAAPTKPAKKEVATPKEQVKPSTQVKPEKHPGKTQGKEPDGTEPKGPDGNPKGPDGNPPKGPDGKRVELEKTKVDKAPAAKGKQVTGAAKK